MLDFRLKAGMNAGSHPDPGVSAAHVLPLASTAVGSGTGPDSDFPVGAKRVQMSMTQPPEKAQEKTRGSTLCAFSHGGSGIH